MQGASPKRSAKAKPSRLGEGEKVERNRIRNRDASSRHSFDIQNIAEIRPVSDPDWAERQACALDFERFVRLHWNVYPYFYLPFSRDHRKAIAKIETAVIGDGLFALAMPRGFGKTSLCRAAAVWALLHAHRRFALLVAADASQAIRSLDGIKQMVLDGAHLRTHYPEVLTPVLALEGESKKQGGQRFQGELTEIHWGGDHLRLPKLLPHKNIRAEQHASGGAVVHMTGLMGSKVRGFLIRGERPDLLICDDPQTDTSARSPAACEKREAVLSGMAMGLAGAGRKIAGVMPCTVIEAGDMADRILDHAAHPEWDSSRTKTLYSFPARMELWEKYRDIRNNYNPYAEERDQKRAQTEATEFYRANHTEMNEGAEVAWPELFARDEVDALQSAMNLWYQDRRKFMAEKQNDPMPPDLGNVATLTAAEICDKLSGVPRGIVPMEATQVTAFVDVQQTAVYWVACAWAEGFVGWVVDYGTFPRQPRAYFSLADLPRTLAQETGIAGIEGQIRRGVQVTADALIGREWQRQGGGTVRTDLVLVDSGKWAKLIYEFVRNNGQYGNRLYPSKGMFVGATSAKDVDEGQQKPGDRWGLKWRMPAAKEDRGCKLVLINVNFWKSFVHERIRVAQGNAGCLTLFGSDSGEHRLFADHLTAEYATEVRSKQRECVVWEERPGHPDNHWLDCLVGAAVAAQMQGITLEGVYRPKPKARRVVDYSEMYREAKKHDTAKP